MGFFARLRASAAFGRASRFEREGKPSEALSEYQRALSLLSIGAARQEEAEACLFMFLVVQIERLAILLNQQGSTVKELDAAVTLIEEHRALTGAMDIELSDSLHVLKERLRLFGGAS